MTRATVMVLACVLIASRAASAQSCTPPEHPFFEYQVEVPATFIGDTAVRPRPKQILRGDFQRQIEGLVISTFVVDTLGVVQTNTIKILQTPSPGASAAARAAIPGWKYTPALVGGCRVAQLVQAPVEP
jgi:hypothetical protein